jgi:hypothetical protein
MHSHFQTRLHSEQLHLTFWRKALGVRPTEDSERKHAGRVDSLTHRPHVDAAMSYSFERCFEKGALSKCRVSRNVDGCVNRQTRHPIHKAILS